MDRVADAETSLRRFKMTTTVATDYDNIEIQQQYSDVNNRWDVDEWDNENSSARLFERSRIKALAGRNFALIAIAAVG
ncbi:Spectrin beta chain, brain 1, partial [Ophiophagus hannah]